MRPGHCARCGRRAKGPRCYGCIKIVGNRLRKEQEERAQVAALEALLLKMAPGVQVARPARREVTYRREVFEVVWDGA